VLVRVLARVLARVLEVAWIGEAGWKDWELCRDAAGGPRVWRVFESSGAARQMTCPRVLARVLKQYKSNQNIDLHALPGFR
jgi:hypothetical protein